MHNALHFVEMEVKLNQELKKVISFHLEGTNLLPPFSCKQDKEASYLHSSRFRKFPGEYLNHKMLFSLICRWWGRGDLRKWDSQGEEEEEGQEEQREQRQQEAVAQRGEFDVFSHRVWKSSPDEMIDKNDSTLNISSAFQTIKGTVIWLSLHVGKTATHHLTFRLWCNFEGCKWNNIISWFFSASYFKPVSLCAFYVIDKDKELW